MGLSTQWAETMETTTTGFLPTCLDFRSWVIPEEEYEFTTLYYQPLECGDSAFCEWGLDDNFNTVCVANAETVDEEVIIQNSTTACDEELEPQDIFDP